MKTSSGRHHMEHTGFYHDGSHAQGVVQQPAYDGSQSNSTRFQLVALPQQSETTHTGQTLATGRVRQGRGSHIGNSHHQNGYPQQQAHGAGQHFLIQLPADSSNGGAFQVGVLGCLWRNSIVSNYLGVLDATRSAHTDSQPGRGQLSDPRPRGTVQYTVPALLLATSPDPTTLPTAPAAQRDAG